MVSILKFLLMIITINNLTKWYLIYYHTLNYIDTITNVLTMGIIYIESLEEDGGDKGEEERVHFREPFWISVGTFN